MRPLTTHPKNLLFDADDTLWENNIYFEQAIANFIAYLDHRTRPPSEVREHLNTCERATISAYGYGLGSFRRSLVSCFEQLSTSPVTSQMHSEIVGFADTIADHQIDLLPAVAETLQQLSTRHRLLLVTKGDVGEQIAKLERSGLAPLFSAVEVLAEKNLAAYGDLIVRHKCDPGSTWMIGNSPRSDINPALAAGLNAVFIPHDQTWVLEHELLSRPVPPRRLLELPAISALLEHF